MSVFTKVTDWVQQFAYGFQRIVFREQRLAVAITGNPSGGLPPRQSSFFPLGRSRETKDALSSYLQFGWTVWDCSEERSDAALDLARRIGSEGLIVLFRPKNERFAFTIREANSHGYNNLLFLYASVASGERMVSEAFAHSQPLTLSVALEDEDVPKPELVRMDMVTAAPALEELLNLTKKVRPFYLIEKIEENGRALLWDFAETHGYRIRTVEEDRLVPSAAELPARVFLVPNEKAAF